MTFVLDEREWRGGIGRFARETTPFLPPHVGLSSPHRPTHPLAPLELSLALRRLGHPGPFFSHGYVPPLVSGVPAVVTLHDLMYLKGHAIRSPARAGYMNALRHLYRRCPAVVTMSCAARAAVERWLGGATRVEAVGGGVGPAFHPGEQAGRDGPPAALYVGSRAPNKNISGLLRGFAAAEVPPVLRVTGTKAAWAKHVATIDTRVASRVEYLGDVPERALPDEYRRASVLVIPSFEEGYGLPALEAMACGTPVVYGRCGALLEVVGDAGLGVDPGDPTAIGAAVDEILGNERRAAELIAAGRQRAAGRTWEAVAARITAVLTSLT